MQPRHWIMLLSLLATLVLVFSLDEEEEDIGLAAVRPVQRTANPPKPAAGVASPLATQPGTATTAPASRGYLAWNLLQGREAPESNKTEADLFHTQHWYVPPVKTAAELAPPPPVAPEPGFAYMGKLEEGPQGNIILLASTSRVYSVRIGERIDPSWRLDREDEQGLSLTYLPLNLPKTLLKHSKGSAPVHPASHLQGDPDDLQGNL